jgi:hypothetical protein
MPTWKKAAGEAAGFTKKQQTISQTGFDSGYLMKLLWLRKRPEYRCRR